jgi:ADP-ribose pyrophosphatase
MDETVTPGGGRQIETAYRSDQLDVRTTQVVVRGQVQQFEWVGRPLVVLAVPCTRDGRLVLVRQYRSAVDGYALEFPAGKVEPGEDLDRAMARELREEAGYRIEAACYLGTLLTAPHFSDETVHVYMTSGDIVTQPMPTPKEQLTVRLIPHAEIDGLIRSGELADAKSLAALLLQQRKDHRP